MKNYLAAGLAVVLAAGCAGVQEAPPSEMAQSAPVLVEPALGGPSQDRAVAAGPPAAGPRQPVMAGNEAVGIEPEAGALAPQTPTSKSPSAAKAAPPPAKAARPLVESPARVSAAPPAVVQPRKIEDPPAVARNPEPPLDVAALKARLRDTNAIGVFTKLALKNQVDDLMQQFRTHHQSGQPSVASLRQPYDMLVLKVLSVVQDNDPALARTISASREAIWGILADPEKFNSIA